MGIVMFISLIIIIVILPISVNITNTITIFVIVIIIMKAIDSDVGRLGQRITLCIVVNQPGF